MSVSIVKRKCPSCQSENLEYGEDRVRSVAFIPNGRKGLVLHTGYAPLLYVCLDCGVLGHYLGRGDLQALKKELAERK